MNVFKARERKAQDGGHSGVWHYTMTNTSTETTVPIGACAKSCPGHPSAAEAYEHQRQWQLDHVDYSRPLTMDTSTECDVCAQPSEMGYAVPLGPYVVALCSEHLNREGLEKVLQVGETWAS